MSSGRTQTPFVATISLCRHHRTTTLSHHPSHHCMCLIIFASFNHQALIPSTTEPRFGMNGFTTFKHLETYSFLLELSASTCFTRLLFHHPRTPPSLYTEISSLRDQCESFTHHYLLLVKNMAKEAWVFVLINCQEYMLMFKMMHRSKASAKKERAAAGVKWEITTSSNEHKQQSTVSTTQKASKTTATLR
ncbi:hypothetical protein LXL04_037520 [Taraxacum kok-saghyz]